MHFIPISYSHVIVAFNLIAEFVGSYQFLQNAHFLEEISFVLAIPFIS